MNALELVLYSVALAAAAFLAGWEAHQYWDPKNGSGNDAGFTADRDFEEHENKDL